MARKDVDQSLAPAGAPTDKKRKPRKSNGKNRRTQHQLERQEKVFMLHLQGITTRALAKQFNCSQPTILSDLRAEETRRSAELGERREAETAAAIAVYRDIYRRALAKSDMYDEVLASAMERVELIEKGAEEDSLGEKRRKVDYQAAGIHVTDRSLDAALKAQERIDKIRGIDAPTKVELGVVGLIDALALKDGEPEVRA